MVAYDYPILGVFWTFLIFFVFVMWFFILFRVIVDIFRSHDMGGFVKVLWLIFVLFLPFLGVFVYLIARGRHMAERDQAEAKASQEAMDAYIRQTATTSTSSADELTKLAGLRDSGVITEQEFAAQKAKLLA